MNELRIILLVIGIAVIAFIYLWETRKQKHKLRSRIENYHAPARSAPKIAPAVKTGMEEAREMADFNLFRHREETSALTKPLTVKKSPPNAGNDPDLWSKAEPGVVNLKPSKSAEQEIVVIYIIADKQSYFNGTDILQAAAAADLHYGDMRIFHNYGPDRKHARRPLYSLANISEPGYFVLEDMQTFTTRGLALFLCLPAEMGGDIAFEFMLEAAQALAGTLGGALYGADRKPLDDDAVNKLRVIASLY